MVVKRLALESDCSRVQILSIMLLTIWPWDNPEWWCLSGPSRGPWHLVSDQKWEPLLFSLPDSHRPLQQASSCLTQLHLEEYCYDSSLFSSSEQLKVIRSRLCGRWVIQWDLNTGLSDAQWLAHVLNPTMCDLQSYFLTHPSNTCLFKKFC